MKEIVLLCVTFSLVIIELFVAMIYADVIQLLLQKNRLWFRLFLLWLSILFIQTAFYTWLPGRIGAEISMFDGLIILEDGALIRNFGYMIMAHTIAIGLSLAKYLWGVIRKENRFDGKFILLDIAVIVLFSFISAQLMQSEYVINFSGGEAAGTIVMAILAVIGFAVVFTGFRQDQAEKKEKKEKQKAEKAAAKKKSSGSLTRFDQIMAEKNRLTEMGDYASQIPLLIEAVGLDVDAARKSQIWNYLGQAYKNIDCEEKAAECFNNAKKTAP